MKINFYMEKKFSKPKKKKKTAPPNCNELKNIKYALKTHEFVKMQEEYEIFTVKDIFKWLLKK